MHQVPGWAQAKTTVLGSEVALVAGVLSILLAFAITGEPTLFNLMVSIGGLAAIVVFAIGLLLLRSGAGRRASAGFIGIVISVLVLGVGYTTVDPLQTAGSVWQALDLLLVLVGDVAALAGGVLLGVSLGSQAGGSLGKASGYVFLVGGILQMGAGIPDSGAILMESTYLGDVGHVLDGIAGIVFVVIGPALLYIAIRRLRHSTVSSEKDVKAQTHDRSK